MLDLDLSPYYEKLALVGHAPDTAGGKRVLGALILADADQQAERELEELRKTREGVNRPMSIKEAARRLGKSESCIRNYIDNYLHQNPDGQQLPAHRMGGKPNGRWLVKPEDVAALLEGKEAGEAAELLKTEN